MRQNLALTSVGVNDTSFVREELQTLKRQKFISVSDEFSPKEKIR